MMRPQLNPSPVFAVSSLPPQHCRRVYMRRTQRGHERAEPGRRANHQGDREVGAGIGG